MQQLYDWLDRKLRTRRRRLCELARATGEFRRHVGGRILFGQVTLSAVPAHEFLYASRVTWPICEHVQLYEDCVLDGILDVLMVQHTYPVLAVAVTLEEIVWHEVDFCALAYGMAARQAIEHILSPEGRAPNYEFVDTSPA